MRRPRWVALQRALVTAAMLVGQPPVAVCVPERERIRERRRGHAFAGMHQGQVDAGAAAERPSQPEPCGGPARRAHAVDQEMAGTTALVAVAGACGDEQRIVAGRELPAQAGLAMPIELRDQHGERHQCQRRDFREPRPRAPQDDPQDFGGGPEQQCEAQVEQEVMQPQARRAIDRPRARTPKSPRATRGLRPAASTGATEMARTFGCMRCRDAASITRSRSSPLTGWLSTSD